MVAIVIMDYTILNGVIATRTLPYEDHTIIDITITDMCIMIILAELAMVQYIESPHTIERRITKDIIETGMDRNALKIANLQDITMNGTMVETTERGQVTIAILQATVGYIVSITTNMTIVIIQALLNSTSLQSTKMLITEDVMGEVMQPRITRTLVTENHIVQVESKVRNIHANAERQDLEILIVSQAMASILLERALNAQKHKNLLDTDSVEIVRRVVVLNLLVRNQIMQENRVKPKAQSAHVTASLNKVALHVRRAVQEVKAQNVKASARVKEAALRAKRAVQEPKDRNVDKVALHARRAVQEVKARKAYAIVSHK